MALILNEEQKMLKDSANEFLAANAPVEQFRTLRDNHYEAFDGDLWPAFPNGSRRVSTISGLGARDGCVCRRNPACGRVDGGLVALPYHGLGMDGSGAGDFS